MTIRIVSRITLIQSFPMIFVPRELPDAHLSFPSKIVEFAPLQRIVHSNLVNNIISMNCLTLSICKHIALS